MLQKQLKLRQPKKNKFFIMWIRQGRHEDTYDKLTVTVFKEKQELSSSFFLSWYIWLAGFLDINYIDL